jgi:hypothetical protein
MRATRAAVVIAVLAWAGIANAAETPEDVARAFCAARVSSSDEATRKVLSHGLLDAIAEAEKRNAAAQAAMPDDKPPLGDGIPYQSFPDVPEACAPGKVTVVGNVTEVGVVYSFASSPNAGWTDVLLLAPGGEGYLIDDIRLLGSADGSDAVLLSDVLKSAFDQ